MLMNEFTSDESKIRVAEALYPAVVDRDNGPQVYAALSTSPSRDQLTERISAIL